MLGFQNRVRANKSGCLDQCEHGPTVVVYPEAVWYGRVTLADVDEIIASHILGGQPVTRLMIADSCLNAPSCPHRMPKTGGSQQTVPLQLPRSAEQSS